MKAGFSNVGLNLSTICSLFTAELYSFTMLFAVWCFFFFILYYILARKIIKIFIAHFIHIAGFAGCHNYFVRCVNFLHIAP